MLGHLGITSCVHRFNCLAHLKTWHLAKKNSGLAFEMFWRLKWFSLLTFKEYFCYYMRSWDTRWQVKKKPPCLWWSTVSKETVHVFLIFLVFLIQLTSKGIYQISVADKKSGKMVLYFYKSIWDSAFIFWFLVIFWKCRVVIFQFHFVIKLRISYASHTLLPGWAGK